MGVLAQGRRRGSLQAGSHAKVAEHHSAILVDEDVRRLHSSAVLSAVRQHSERLNK